LGKSSGHVFVILYQKIFFLEINATPLT
jgi:hypothetical protein